jgi:hypothetical protein
MPEGIWPQKVYMALWDIFVYFFILAIHFFFKASVAKPHHIDAVPALGGLNYAVPSPASPPIPKCIYCTL